jgi:hypothetical protein
MNNTGIELPGAPFLYTMGIIGMTFIGFSAIVMLLRQTSGRKLRPFDALFAHVYMEFGLIVSVGAMLPPLFAPLDVWRLMSGLGQNSDVKTLHFDVCFPPESRHLQCTTRCLLWANSGHCSTDPCIHLRRTY